MRRTSSRRLLSAALAALATLAVPGQDSAPASRPLVDRLVDRANHQNPYFSAQGLKALKTQGEAALPALERFVTRRSIHALAPLVVEWLGELSDDRARNLLKEALANGKFPWRPQAAKALARAPREDELDLFIGLSRDALPAVRESALVALGEFSKDRAARPKALAALERGLRDPLFEPRLAAAESLLDLGERAPLSVLLDALRVERRFFELDFGVIARRRAWAAVEPLVGPGVAFDPSRDPRTNTEALAALRERLGEEAASRAAGADVPLAPDVADAVFGVEIRSCRAGDQWIRVTASGELVLGHYDLARRALEPAEHARITRLLDEIAAPSEGRPRLQPGAYLGRPGCDFEKWYLPDESGLLRVTVGLEGRPARLEELSAALGAAIERAFGPTAGEEFTDRTLPFAKPEDGED